MKVRLKLKSLRLLKFHEVIAIPLSLVTVIVNNIALHYKENL